jgi:hypothetical protein
VVTDVHEDRRDMLSLGLLHQVIVVHDVEIIKKEPIIKLGKQLKELLFKRASLVEKFVGPAIRLAYARTHR